MKVINLTERESIPAKVYTCNVYLVLGGSNAMEDVNTMVDVGMDPGVMDRIEAAATGVGKKRVAQVILTHNHFDHAGLLSKVRERFHPMVRAFSAMDGVDQTLRDGQKIRMGDREFEVFHTPGHSHDSVCLYCKEDRVLFAGDTPLLIRSGSATYEDEYVRALERLAALRIDTIYFGHGEPLTNSASERIRDSLAVIRKSRQTSSAAG